MSDPVLRGTGLVQRYGSTAAVAGVDLQVAAGEVFGLLGPNGAGKSTVFRLLAGLERAQRGTVSLLGRDVTRWPLHRRARAGLGWLPQHASVLPRLSSRHNVQVALRSVGRPPADADAILDEAGLAGVAAQAAGSLSGGERRRLEVARCLALRPRVMLLDEPFAGMDPASVELLQQRLRDLAAAGLAIVLTDHAVREAMAICDTVALLDAGVVQVRGTPAEVAVDPRARSRYLGAGFRLDPPRAIEPPAPDES